MFASAVRAPSGSPDVTTARRTVRDVLSVMRAHTGMEVAFLGRVAEGRRTFEFVDTDPAFSPVSPGTGDDLEDTYCGRVLDGRAPELIVDAALEPAVRDLPVTEELAIGSHLSVPVHTPCGAVYGTLCCFTREVRPDLQERDLDAMRMFAAVVGKHLEPLIAEQTSLTAAREQICTVLDRGGPAMALQPITDITSGAVYGYEALARFPTSVTWSPECWFATAEHVGLGVDLEASAVESALAVLPRLPAGAHLSVNVSVPALLSGPRISHLLARTDASRIILELTEHHEVASTALLADALSPLRDRGVRIAVDDAGSGYAGLERILALSPEVLKLDRSLIEGLAEHPGREAMCEAMVGFTRRTGALLVAEGVEERTDLDRLRALGVTHAQGYLLGAPAFWG